MLRVIFSIYSFPGNVLRRQFLISTSISACDLGNLFFTHKVVNNNRVVVESETLFSANLSYSDPILSPLKTSLEYSENDYLFIYLFKYVKTNEIKFLRRFGDIITT